MGTGTILRRLLCLGQEKKGGGSKWGRPALESVAGGVWFEVLWNLECPVGLSQREICVHFNEGNLVQFRWSAKKKEKKGEVCSEILI